MRPAENAAYCHVGAGVARAANGQTYYVLQAAYTSDKSCGPYEAPPGGAPGGPIVPGIIVPVKIATPDADGKIWHEVQAGQSYWAIAIAYKVTIKDLQYWNNLPETYKLQPGDKLFIPSSNTKGYFTPTPVGMVLKATPDKDGNIIHNVEAYQTLITIAQAYSVTVDTILAMNGLQVDWPLQIGQKLFIPNPNSTPSPLDPLQRLTPAADGKYYHIVQPGESLSRIADIYHLSVNQLMLWNGLNGESVIQPNQKLLLLVTPPATATHTPAPPTQTPSPPPSPTATLTPTRQAPPSPTASTLPSDQPDAWQTLRWAVLAALAAGGLIGLGLVLRKKG
jgi:LysM repeat protein